nr:MAG: RNA-dependent RNA polymerase [Chemarfal virus 123]
MTRQQFVECYTGRRREVYQRAANSLAVRALCWADAFLSTFTKCEKIDFYTKPDPAPRVIQPRSPRYNVEVGRFLKALEKILCRGIAEIWGGPTILKGMNAGGVADALRSMWVEFADPVAVSIDATRFDQHVSKEALEWEHSVYLKMFPEGVRPKLAKLLEMQLVNRGYGRTEDCTLMYEVEGRRMSGDMNTGMGNCLLMCSMIHWYARKHNLKCRLGNNGDDCVLIMDKKDLGKVAALSEDILGFGFVLEIEQPVYVFEQIDFCQNHPVYDGESWVMVRDPRKCIDKDLVTVLDLGNLKGCQKWAHAIGNGGAALSGGIPVLHEFYRMLLRVGKAGKSHDHPWLENGFMMMSRGMGRQDKTTTAQARVSFWRAFGITPDQQLAIEEVYSHTTLNLSAGESKSPLDSFKYLWE